MAISQNISNIASALLKAQKEMGNAVKDSKNLFFKSKYADLNSVREAVTPALHNNGITVLQLNTPVNGKEYVETLLLHESGEFISSLTEIVCKEANNPQAYGSAISYARRYGLGSMLSVGTEDDDGESAMARNNTKTSSAPKEKEVITQTNGKSDFGTFRKTAKASTTASVGSTDGF
jgi:hypothetical protein